MEFLDGLAMETEEAPCSIFVDNLGVHLTHLVKDAAVRNHQELLFNGTYTSELNPIEHLWQHSKHKFRRDLISKTNFKDADAMFSLVKKSIRSVKPALVKMHVESCFRKMQEYLVHLPSRLEYPK